MLSEEQRQLNQKRQVRLKTCADVYEHWRTCKRLYRKAPSDGVEFQIDYIDTGLALSDELRAKAPIALALHGAPGSYHDFALLIQHLTKQNVRVIAPNFPEYTATVKTKVLFRHSADEKAAYLRDFLRAINVNKIDLLVSHSSAIFPTLLILLNANNEAIKARARRDQLRRHQHQLASSISTSIHANNDKSQLSAAQVGPDRTGAADQAADQLGHELQTGDPVELSPAAAADTPIATTRQPGDSHDSLECPDGLGEPNDHDDDQTSGVGEEPDDDIDDDQPQAGQLGDHHALARETLGRVATGPTDSNNNSSRPSATIVFTRNDQHDNSQQVSAAINARQLDDDDDNGTEKKLIIKRFRRIRSKRNTSEVIVKFDQPIEIKAVALFNPAGHRLPKSMKPTWFKCGSCHVYQHKLGRSIFRKFGPGFLTVIGVPVRVDNMDNVMLSATVMRNSKCQRVIKQLEQLSQMKIPTLLVFSENDKLIEKEIFYEMTQFMHLDPKNFDVFNNDGNIELSQSSMEDWIRVMVFKAGGHYAYSNYAKTVNQAVSQLLKKVTNSSEQ